MKQLGIDRIVDFQFGSDEAAYHLIIELYDRVSRERMSETGAWRQSLSSTCLPKKRCFFPPKVSFGKYSTLVSITCGDELIECLDMAVVVVNYKPNIPMRGAL